MTVATGDAAPQNRAEPLYFRRAARRRRRRRCRSPTAATTPAWRTVSITGVAKADLPAESKRLRRQPVVFRAGRNAGRSDQGAADRLSRRGDQGHAHRCGARRPHPGRRSVAGRIRDPDCDRDRRVDAPANYPWLKDLTDAAYTEARDDRYIAALDLADGVRDFTLAYVVRAVTPGEFKYPALVVEDMYEPETAGRTAIGKLTVAARSEPVAFSAAPNLVRRLSVPHPSPIGGAEGTR